MFNNQTYFIYTDASFNKEHSIGVSGCLILKETDNHETITPRESDVILTTFYEKNNIRAEIKGAIFSLKTALTLPQNSKILLYTDCQTISRLESRRKKLEGSDFISQSKKAPLANMDLYKALYELFDKIKPQIHWIQGHSPSNGKNTIQKNFSIIDKAVRKKLRQIVDSK